MGIGIPQHDGREYSPDKRRQRVRADQGHFTSLTTTPNRSDLYSVLVLRGHEGRLNSVAFSPDGKRIVSASSDRTARVWDTASGMEITILRGHAWSVSSAAYSPDAKRVITASVDKTARVWDVDNGRELAVLRANRSAVLCALFSPDGADKVTISDDETVRAWYGSICAERFAARDSGWGN